MINYKIVISTQEKKKFKTEFQDFFTQVYGRKLSDTDWEHQFIHSPYEDSALFLAFDRDKIIGSSLMIPQKFYTKNQEGTYYLWTTSAILKEYRSLGVYAELLKMQREYTQQNKKDFIFAFPNKLAYPVVKLFGGFKDLYKTELVKANISDLDLENIDNSLLIDKNFFNWRFEHREYLFYRINSNIIMSKKYDETLDILAVYPQELLKDIDIKIETSKILEDIITIKSFLKEGSQVRVIDQLNGTYYPINKEIDYASIRLNLLMSDVF
jgi:hypothetical protein